MFNRHSTTFYWHFKKFVQSTATVILTFLEQPTYQLLRIDLTRTATYSEKFVFY